MKSLKTWWAFVGALVADTSIYVSDDKITGGEWLAMSSILATVVGVYFFPNLKNGENVQTLADEALRKRSTTPFNN